MREVLCMDLQAAHSPRRHGLTYGAPIPTGPQRRPRNHRQRQRWPGSPPV